MLAVRFAVQTGVPYIEFVGNRNRAFSFLLTDATNINFFRQHDIRGPLDYFKFGFFLLLAIIHVALFYFDTSRKSNFYFFLSTFSFAINSILLALVDYYVQYAATKMGFLIAASVLYVVGAIFFLTALYSIFNHRRGVVYWSLLAYGLISIVLLFAHYHNSYNFGISLFAFLAFFEAIRIAFLGSQRKQRGAAIIVGGAISFLIFYTLWAVILFNLFAGWPCLDLWAFGL